MKTKPAVSSPKTGFVQIDTALAHIDTIFDYPPPAMPMLICTCADCVEPEILAAMARARPSEVTEMMASEFFNAAPKHNDDGSPVSPEHHSDRAQEHWAEAAWLLPRLTRDLVTNALAIEGQKTRSEDKIWYTNPLLDEFGVLTHSQVIEQISAPQRAALTQVWHLATDKAATWRIDMLQTTLEFMGCFGGGIRPYLEKLAQRPLRWQLMFCFTLCLRCNCRCCRKRGRNFDNSVEHFNESLNHDQACALAQFFYRPQLTHFAERYVFSAKQPQVAKLVSDWLKWREGAELELLENGFLNDRFEGPNPA